MLPETPKTTSGRGAGLLLVTVVILVVRAVEDLHAGFLLPASAPGAARRTRLEGTTPGLVAAHPRCSYLESLRQLEVFVGDVLERRVLAQLRLPALAPGPDHHDLRGGGVLVDALFAQCKDTVAHDAQHRGLEARDPALREHAFAARQILGLADLLLEGNELVDASREGDGALALDTEHLGAHHPLTHRLVEHDGKVEVVADAKVDGRVGDRGIETELDVRAGTRM